MTAEYNKILLHISCVNALGSFVHSRIVHCWRKRASLAALVRHTMCARMYRAKSIKQHDEKATMPRDTSSKCVSRLLCGHHTFICSFYLNSPSCRPCEAAKPAHIHMPSYFGEILRSPGEKLAFYGFWRNVSQHFEARSGSLNSAIRQSSRWKSLPPLDRSDLFRRSTCWFLEDSRQLQRKLKHMQNVCY